MSDQSVTQLLSIRICFAALVLAILFFQLLPLDTLPSRWAGPDLVFAFACAWVVRRPEYVPIGLLAVLFFLADLMLQRPPGIWAALALLGSEHLKSRARLLRDSGFATEWFKVCLVLISVALVNRLVLMITFVDLPSLALTISELVMTMLVYPFVVAVSHGVMGVRKPVPGDFESGGKRSV